MRFHFNQWDSRKCFWLVFPSYSQNLDLLIFIIRIFTPGRLGYSPLLVSHYNFEFPLRAVLAGWLLPAPWLAQRWEEPGFSLLCGLGLSSSASDSWLRSGRQCVQFYSSRCEIFFVMLSWKVKKLGWLLCHSPRNNRGLSTKDGESMWLCIPLVCGLLVCSKLPLLWYFSSSWGAGSKTVCKRSTFYSRKCSAYSGALKAKRSSHAHQEGSCLLEVVLLLLPPRISR